MKFSFKEFFSVCAVMESLKAHFRISLSLPIKNPYMLHCFVLFYLERKELIRNHYYHCCLLCAIHFYFSDIFSNFRSKSNFANNNFSDIWYGLNFADGNFCNVLRGLYFLEKAEIRKI